MPPPARPAAVAARASAARPAPLAPALAAAGGAGGGSRRLLKSGPKLTDSQAMVAAGPGDSRATTSNHDQSVSVAGNGAVTARAAMSWDFAKGADCDLPGAGCSRPAADGGGGFGGGFGGDGYDPQLFARDMAALDARP
jgi:hypothetical protein